MNELKPNKNSIAEQLRAFTAAVPLPTALAAIDGLGELGGTVAVKHIEELLEEVSHQGGGESREKWAALIRAYGRAGRYLTENE